MYKFTFGIVLVLFAFHFTIELHSQGFECPSNASQITWKDTSYTLQDSVYGTLGSFPYKASTPYYGEGTKFIIDLDSFTNYVSSFGVPDSAILRLTMGSFISSLRPHGIPTDSSGQCYNMFVYFRKTCFGYSYCYHKLDQQRRLECCPDSVLAQNEMFTDTTGTYYYKSVTKVPCSYSCCEWRLYVCGKQNQPKYTINITNKEGENGQYCISPVTIIDCKSQDPIECNQGANCLTIP